MGVRRVYCRGNCGRWWYYDAEPREQGKHRGGRPREWCDRCWPMHRSASRVGHWKRDLIRMVEREREAG